MGLRWFQLPLLLLASLTIIIVIIIIIITLLFELNCLVLFSRRCFERIKEKEVLVHVARVK
jgi:hypothetical protein